jgi:fatty acid desaturase
VCAAVANVGFASASANAFAPSNRSAGSFSSAFATAAATFAGTAFRYFVTDSAGSVMIFMMICCAAAPVCGGLPVSIS